jgi:hypothetical protein
MPRGGKRQGAGRPSGAPNKKTAALQKAVAEQGITPLDYLLSVLRDEGQDKASRVEAAKAAAPYVHPRLTAVDASIKSEVSQTHSFDKQSLEQAVEALNERLNAARTGDT